MFLNEELYISQDSWLGNIIDINQMLTLHVTAVIYYYNIQ